MKYISNILLILLAVCFVASCQDDECTSQSQGTPQVGVFGDEMKLCLNVVAPDPIAAGTRAVDPDGKTLQTLHLFCFDANGLFLTTATAELKGNIQDENLSGTFSATIPKTTRIIHLLGNQNLTVFDRDAYTYKTEDDVLSALEGSAGMMIYWARIQAPLNVNELYTDAQYSFDNDGKTINERTEAEAFVDWITIETNAADSKHRNVAGKGHPIILLRNQSKFTIVSEGTGSDANDEWKGTYFEVTGFTICNTPAFGTVAPYNTEYGFPTYACSTFTPAFAVTDHNDDEVLYPNWLDEKEATLAARRDKMSDIADVSTQREYHIFETNNLGNDPVDLILRGRNIVNGVAEQERYYYRVNIIDSDYEQIKILRNHHYEVHIDGNLSNGCLTFDEALVAPPTNNIWISISDDVNSVRNNDYILTVPETKVIVEAAAANGMPEQSELKLEYNIEAIYPENKPVDISKIKVYWVEEDQKVSNTFFTPIKVDDNESYVDGRKVTYDEATGEGVITLAVNRLVDGSEYERGTIIVKYGHLQRKIRILLMRAKQFVPTWVSSEVYGSAITDGVNTRSNVTVVFNIPNTCPAELFPMDVLITTNNLDGRAGTGQILPIVRKGDDDYGKSFGGEGEMELKAPDGTKVSDLGYKYKVTVTEPGQHRVYFQNILNMENKSSEYVVLEADHFDFMVKMVTYVDHYKKIVMPNLLSYTTNPGASESEVVQYILVPQKRFVPVVFDIALKESDGTSYATLTNEEFLLYSTNLDHYTDDDSRIPAAHGNVNAQSMYYFSRQDFDCTFKPYEEALWSTGGRIFGFYPRKEKLADGSFYKPIGGGNQIFDYFQIFMETNKPGSAEVIRIASNQQGSPQVKDPTRMYENETFRSVVFELANYRPFRFAAQVNDIGRYVADDATSGTQAPEVVDDIQFEYMPDEVVAVSFDVTSFKAEDGTSISPFGTGFEIFIDAPMLKLEKGMNKSLSYYNYNKNFEDIMVPMFDKDANGVGYTEQKPKLEDLGNGRFVYRVDPMVNDEAAHWDGDPLIRDEFYSFPLTGDRKTIYFKKNSIVSSGEITVSANPEHITYHSKTFKVSNAPIQGRIGYIPAGSDEPLQVPFGQFVSFARAYDGSRVGSLTVRSYNEDAPNASTYYELRLRAEYEFAWVNDPILITCSIDGVYYSTTISDLRTLYETPNKSIILTEMKEE